MAPANWKPTGKSRDNANPKKRGRCVRACAWEIGEWTSGNKRPDTARRQRKGLLPVSDSTPDRRRRWRKYHELQSAVHQQWQERGYRYPPPATPPFPDDLRGLACGARTKAGTPCKLTAIYLNGRCKWHGGCSTGPTTEAGKEQSRVNGRMGGRPKKKPDQEPDS